MTKNIVSYDADANCWRWTASILVDGNTRAEISGETTTKARAIAARKSALHALGCLRREFLTSLTARLIGNGETT